MKSGSDAQQTLFSLNNCIRFVSDESCSEKKNVTKPETIYVEVPKHC